MDDRGLGADYAYLLGIYLGDGCLTLTHRGVWKLRISADARYAGIIDRIRGAVSEVSAHRSGTVTRDGCVEIYSCWRHWYCLFPQHGPGEKHRRRIALEGWQGSLVQRHPQEFIKGLVHSDGCRVINRVTNRHRDDRLKRYWYPRYFFTNHSAEIRELFVWACALIGVESRPNNQWNISVAKRESVAILDSFIGPKR